MDYQSAQRGEPVEVVAKGKGSKKDQQKIEIKRDFSCVCDSIKADILFLSNSLILPIMKMHGIGLVE